jgi:hypothetical protein
MVFDPCRGKPAISILISICKPLELALLSYNWLQLPFDIAVIGTAVRINAKTAEGQALACVAAGHPAGSAARFQALSNRLLT